MSEDKPRNIMAGDIAKIADAHRLLRGELRNGLREQADATGAHYLLLQALSAEVDVLAKRCTVLEDRVIKLQQRNKLKERDYLSDFQSLNGDV